MLTPRQQTNHNSGPVAHRTHQQPRHEAKRPAHSPPGGALTQLSSGYHAGSQARVGGRVSPAVRSLWPAGPMGCRTFGPPPRSWGEGASQPGRLSPNRPPSGSFQRGHVENRSPSGCLGWRPARLMSRSDPAMDVWSNSPLVDRLEVLAVFLICSPRRFGGSSAGRSAGGSGAESRTRRPPPPQGRTSARLWSYLAAAPTPDGGDHHVFVRICWQRADASAPASSRPSASQHG